MAKERVVVEIHFGVERDHLTGTGQNQRIDLGKRRVGLVERLVKSLQRRPRFGDRISGNADFACDIVALAILQAGSRIDENLVDFLRPVGGDFFDVHAAFAARHQAHTLRAAVDDHADIQFFFDVSTFFNQQPPHFLAFGSGLMRLE